MRSDDGMGLLTMDVAGTLAVRVDADERNGLDAELHDIFQRMADVPEGTAERDRLRTQAIERALPVVNRLARRFRGRGEQLEDLVQAGALALVKAVDSYDPGRRVPFTGYLVPCVVGALKRHFRDKGWDIRVPRQLQERHLRLENATGALAQRLGRAPTPAELAVEVGMSADEVVAGLVARQAYDSSSLNEPAGVDSGDERQDLLGGPDPDLEEAADRVSVGPLLRQLPERERIIVTRRYFGNQTQAQIAAELGISQMHVSRILDRILRWLRRALLDDGRPGYPGAEVDRPLGVSVYVTGSAVLVTVRGAVDARAATYLRTALVDATMAHRPRYVIVDLHGVPDMAIAGVAAFLAARSACGHVGARLRLTRVTAPVAGTLGRAGLGWLVNGGRPYPAEPAHPEHPVAPTQPSPAAAAAAAPPAVSAAPPAAAAAPPTCPAAPQATPTRPLRVPARPVRARPIRVRARVARPRRPAACPVVRRAGAPPAEVRAARPPPAALVVHERQVKRPTTSQAARTVSGGADRVSRNQRHAHQKEARRWTQWLRVPVSLTSPLILT
ncbi:SigB/SigF/SigG family RNA polymerase sigma factor [Planosporangium thailandense]|uniref:SigB/SigF/SigG family RNA polymerase sigma factor n=1 Tax=Planosporangium thailandense TaxID=765197 RepID=A0ABX0XYV7_9ACTN|nr:SigB/SigF/SigG family RNA polymerase sigma factor [Planosporangium thailandense]NJC71226.1 SigB/SigF/SigG family RNA polymerase sigma factor [Planosporangium thailandense]